MTKYLCYDIRGIQQFIFSIPQLKYIIGGSLLIADFDRKIRATPQDGIEPIFTGGGKGVFYVKEKENIEHLQDELIKRAHNLGLDIRIGSADRFTDAMTAADELYPYLPMSEDLDGYPCEVSGLWPVAEGKGKGPNKKIHPMIFQRKQTLTTGDYFTEKFLNKDSVIGQSIAQKFNGYQPQFFTHISGEDEESSQEVLLRGRAGDCALGSRRRWAVIAMDGNDMGAQFRTAATQEKDDEKARDRIASMSRELAACTIGAFEQSLIYVIEDWLAEADLDKCTYPEGNEQRLVLPFRPLILGGDDIVLLAHCAYALKFVRNMSEAFTSKSEKAANRIKSESGFNLWPATSNKLTISAGIAYTGVTYPLHTSIPYAESLLAGAKDGMRNPKTDAKGKGLEPTPAGIDWEHITESLIDTPAARRRRDLVFHDEDLARDIRLTRKPYPISGIPELIDNQYQLFQNIPAHIRANLKSILMKPWAQRCCALAALERAGEETKKLADALQQYDTSLKNMGAGWCCEQIGNKEYLSCDILDAISLIDEERRMVRKKQKGGAR